MPDIVGWHYTSLSSWKSIKRQGRIRRYDLGYHRDELRGFVSNGIGIFVFQNLLEGVSLYGTIFDRVITKEEFQVVCLEVRYPTWDSALQQRRRRFPTASLTHTGTLSSTWQYHREPFDIVTFDVPVERVTLVQAWDLAAYLDGNESFSRHEFDFASD